MDWIKISDRKPKDHQLVMVKFWRWGSPLDGSTTAPAIYIEENDKYLSFDGGFTHPPFEWKPIYTEPIP